MGNNKCDYEIDKLKADIKDLQKDRTDLLEILNNLEDFVRMIKSDKVNPILYEQMKEANKIAKNAETFAKEAAQKAEEAKSNIDKINTIAEKAQNIQNNIFSLMSLFFGIFSFIDITYMTKTGNKYKKILMRNITPIDRIKLTYYL